MDTRALSERVAVRHQAAGWPRPLKSKWGHNGALTVVAMFHNKGQFHRPQVMVTVRYAGTGPAFDSTGWDFLFIVRQYPQRTLMNELPPQLVRVWKIDSSGGRDPLPSSAQAISRSLPKGLYMYCKKQALKYTPVLP